MGVIYEKADEDVLQVIQRMLTKYHGELLDSTKKALRVDALMAWGGDDAAVKLHGYACLAVVRIVNYRDRVKGGGDAEITIDGKAWQDMSGRTRDALIDHELYHLVHKQNAKGKFQFDDLGRPKLKMRLHDFEYGWFAAIADRHKDASIERQQAERLFVQHEQLFFPFARSRSSAPAEKSRPDATHGDRPSLN